MICITKSVDDDEDLSLHLQQLLVNLSSPILLANSPQTNLCRLELFVVLRELR